MTAWTDERIDDLATSLRPLPAEVAKLSEAVDRLSGETRSLREDFMSEVRSLREDFMGEVRSLREDFQGETQALRTDLSGSQRQIAHVGWGLVSALVGALAALLIVLL